jgi:hypothetical protein
MKHLKIFEDFESNEYYKEISEDDYNPLFNDEDYIPFEEKYSNKLIQLGFKQSPLNKRCCSTYTNGMNVYVFQRNDEYFDVEIGARKRKYYRCDQFDGLLKLLKDNKILNETPKKV